MSAKSSALRFGVVAALGASACAVVSGLSDLAVVEATDGGSAVREGGLPPGAEADGGGPGSGVDDASAPAVPSGGTVAVASTGVAHGAGGSQQRHLHYAENLKAWVLFSLRASAPDRIEVRLTRDFASFKESEAIVLPRSHVGDGRSFDVAYANRGGHDVFHVGISLKDGASRIHLHARGRDEKPGLSGLVFDPVVEVGRVTANTENPDPDGPAIAILTGGRVLTSTGWAPDVNGNASNFGTFLTKVADDGGASWTAEQHMKLPLPETANESVNARAIAILPTGAAAIWDRGNQEPDPTDLGISVFTSADLKWTPAVGAGFPLTKFSDADWTAVPTSDGKLHAVRYAAGTYLARVYADGAGKDSAAIPPAAQLTGDGVVALALDTSPHVFAIGSDTHELRRTMLTGGAWKPWTPVAPADPGRRNLAGATGDGKMVLLFDRVHDGVIDLCVLPVLH